MGIEARRKNQELKVKSQILKAKCMLLKAREPKVFIEESSNVFDSIIID